MPGRGGKIYLDIDALPLPDARGQVESILMLVREVGEQVRTEDALQTVLQRFYVVLSSMYSAILLVSAEERVEYANQAFCDYFALQEAPAELVGLSAQEMIEKIYTSYRHPDEATARIREILDCGQPVKGEEIAMRDGGTCLRDFVPLLIGGKLYGRLWIHFDISERKQAEEERERLLEQQKIFVHMVSHDLRAPLTIIQGHVGLLEEFLAEADNAQARSSAEAIARGVKRMNIMIQVPGGCRRAWKAVNCR